MDRYRSDGPSSLKRYGQRLNRCSGVRLVPLARHQETIAELSEEDLTRASGVGLHVPTQKRAPARGVLLRRRPFLPLPEGKGLLAAIGETQGGSLLYSKTGNHLHATSC
jgi:hypothetical protein